MGCGSSKSTGVIELPRVCRRADVNAGPPPPKYYGLDTTQSARPGSKERRGRKASSDSQRRLTVLHEGGNGSNAVFGDHDAAADMGVDAKEINLSTHDPKGGKPALLIKEVASGSMVGYDPKKSRKLNQDNFYADVAFAEPDMVRGEA